MKLPFTLILIFASISLYGQSRKLDSLKKPSVTELLSGKVAGLNIQNGIDVVQFRGNIVVGGPTCKICQASALNKIYTHQASFYIFKVGGVHYEITPDQAIEFSLLDSSRHHLTLSKEQVGESNCSIGEKLTCCFFEIKETETLLKERLKREFKRSNIRPISEKKAKKIENSVF